MQNSTATALILIAIGLLTTVGTALNWGIVTLPGKLFNLIIGDTLARIIYFAAGIFPFVVGIRRLIGAHWL